MFGSFGANRLQHERELWIERRKSGKKNFVYLHMVIVGSGCLALFRIPVLLHFWYGRTITHHGKLMALAVILPLGMGVGFLLAQLLWRRSERLVSGTEETTS
jgi:hypothetical protein